FSLDEPSSFAGRIFKMIKLGLDIGDDAEAMEVEETINPIDEASVETSMEEITSIP
ncbi:12866_t:CDS:2, partial [Entrophospora sp. SA101]